MAQIPILSGIYSDEAADLRVALPVKIPQDHHHDQGGGRDAGKIGAQFSSTHQPDQGEDRRLGHAELDRQHIALVALRRSDVPQAQRGQQGNLGDAGDHKAEIGQGRNPIQR